VVEDSVPRIYEQVVGVRYPGPGNDDGRLFDPDDIALLRELSRSDEDPDELHFQVLRELLNIEQGYRTASRRVGIYDALDDSLRKGAFLNEEEALRFARALKAREPSVQEAGDAVESATLELELGVLPGGQR
jgi:DNA sulfur modification protein DndC